MDPELHALWTARRCQAWQATSRQRCLATGVPASWISPEMTVSPGGYLERHDPGNLPADNHHRAHWILPADARCTFGSILTVAIHDDIIGSKGPGPCLGTLARLRWIVTRARRKKTGDDMAYGLTHRLSWQGQACA